MSENPIPAVHMWERWVFSLVREREVGENGDDEKDGLVCEVRIM